jgi:hypothetical protein
MKEWMLALAVVFGAGAMYLELRDCGYLGREEREK